MRILRKPDVLKITSLSASSIERMERHGEFPRRVRLGSNAVGWIEGEILEWIGTLRRGCPSSSMTEQIEDEMASKGTCP